MAWDYLKNLYAKQFYIGGNSQRRLHLQTLFMNSFKSKLETDCIPQRQWLSQTKTCWLSIVLQIPTEQCAFDSHIKWSVFLIWTKNSLHFTSTVVDSVGDWLTIVTQILTQQCVFRALLHHDTLGLTKN